MFGSLLLLIVLLAWWFVGFGRFVCFNLIGVLMFWVVLDELAFLYVCMFTCCLRLRVVWFASVCFGFGNLLVLNFDALDFVMFAVDAFLFW